jgi:hypothetical protein
MTELVTRIIAGRHYCRRNRHHLRLDCPAGELNELQAPNRPRKRRIHARTPNQAGTW